MHNNPIDTSLSHSPSNCCEYITHIKSLHRSDAFIIAIVAIFSLSSGYLTVLIYEFASFDQDKKTQAAATSLLNLSFQVSYTVSKLKIEIVDWLVFFCSLCVSDFS